MLDDFFAVRNAFPANWPRQRNRCFRQFLHPPGRRMFWPEETQSQPGLISATTTPKDPGLSGPFQLYKSYEDHVQSLCRAQHDDVVPNFRNPRFSRRIGRINIRRKPRFLEFGADEIFRSQHRGPRRGTHSPRDDIASAAATIFDGTDCDALQNACAPGVYESRSLGDSGHGGRAFRQINRRGQPAL